MENPLSEMNKKANTYLHCRFSTHESGVREPFSRLGSITAGYPNLAFQPALCWQSIIKYPCSSLRRDEGTYPLGRREAGGMQGHLQSEEGQDVLRRFAEAGRGDIRASAHSERQSAET